MPVNHHICQGYHRATHVDHRTASRRNWGLKMSATMNAAPGDMSHFVPKWMSLWGRGAYVGAGRTGWVFIGVGWQQSPGKPFFPPPPYVPPIDLHNMRFNLRYTLWK